MKKVYVGRHPKGSSMYLVASQIVANYGDIVATKVEDLKGSDVICLSLEEMPKLLAAKKFIGIGAITMLLAGNWEEFDDWHRGALLQLTATTKLVVHSPYSYQEVIKTARTYLAPAKLKAVLQNLYLIPYGVSMEFTATSKGGSNWIVPYNRVNQSQKNILLHIELSTLLASTRTVNQLFIVMQGWGTSKSFDLSIYDLVEQPPTREEYLQLIANRGAFLSTSKYESFGIYYLELLCSGAVGVFMKAPWVDLLFAWVSTSCK